MAFRIRIIPNRTLPLCAFLAAALCFAAAGAYALAPPPAIDARSAVLMDAASGALLYAKNPDLRLPPASLTKLVTLHIAYQEIAAGRLDPDELVEIDGRDCSPSIPYGSSIMYLYPGMKVSVRDLMLGAAVVSGNDAAYALARRIAGSPEAFATRMNEELRSLGFEVMHFEEPSGLSENNMISAREFARFCAVYLKLHPQALGELHSVKSIEFPRKEHTAPGFVPKGDVIQYNRNPLIFSYPGADGLKTGYIIEVGFNMAATAQREGARYIAVTLGGTGSDYADGGRRRTRDSTALLDWAFDNFTSLALDPGPLPSPRVWYGASRRVDLAYGRVNSAAVPRDDAPRTSVRLDIQRAVEAPIAKGEILGHLVYSADGKDLASIPLIARATVERGSFFRRMLDGVERFFAELFAKLKSGRRAGPAAAAGQG